MAGKARFEPATLRAKGANAPPGSSQKDIIRVNTSSIHGDRELYTKTDIKREEERKKETERKRAADR